jgi:hypothetical protein
MTIFVPSDTHYRDLRLSSLEVCHAYARPPGVFARPFVAHGAVQPRIDTSGQKLGQQERAIIRVAR